MNTKFAGRLKGLNFENDRIFFLSAVFSKCMPRSYVEFAKQFVLLMNM